MASNRDDLPGKILKWLDKQGYPFEMFTAMQFQKEGYQVSLSDNYLDYETGSQREIDVTALRWSDLNRTAAIQVCTRIECKSSPEKPWIVFISQAQPELFPPFQHICSSGLRVFLVEMYKNANARKLIITAPLFRPALLGHGLTQALKNKGDEDVTYRAILSSFKACVHRATHFDSPEFLRAPSKNEHFLSVISFPMIAINSRLFECLIDEDSNPHLLEVKSSKLFWSGINPANSTGIISVVTKEGIPEYIQHFTQTCEVLLQLAEANNNILEEAAREVKESILRKTGHPTIIG